MPARSWLLRRGFEPGRGLWAQPGGFLEVDEDAERRRAADAREIGLIVWPEAIVGLTRGSRPP